MNRAKLMKSTLPLVAWAFFCGLLALDAVQCGGNDSSGNSPADAATGDEGIGPDIGGYDNTGVPGGIGSRCQQQANCAQGVCLNGRCEQVGAEGECQTSSDCGDKPGTPYCNGSAKKCVACLINDHCDQGFQCNSAQFVCEPVTTGEGEGGTEGEGVEGEGQPPLGCDPECAAPYPLCKEGTCVGCQSLGCAVGTCNEQTGECDLAPTDGGDETGDIEEPDADDGGDDSGDAEDAADGDAEIEDVQPPASCTVQCVAPTPYCDIDNHLCVSCLVTGCGDNYSCNQATGTCEEIPRGLEPCQCNARCRTDEYCYYYQKASPSQEPKFKCVSRATDLIKAGGKCEQDENCDSFRCVSRAGTFDKYCFDTCCDDTDCKNSFRCQQVTLEEGASVYHLTSCVPPPISCETTANCPPGPPDTSLLCRLIVDPNGWPMTFCESRVGANLGGKACTGDDDCLTGRCLAAKFCDNNKAFCSSDTECGAGRCLDYGKCGGAGTMCHINSDCVPLPSCVLNRYCYEACKDDTSCSSAEALCKGGLVIKGPDGVDNAFKSCVSTDFLPP